MAITKRLIYQTAQGLGNEDWFYLARDAETGRAFVMHEWSRLSGSGLQPGSADIGRSSSPAQARLKTCCAS